MTEHTETLAEILDGDGWEFAGEMQWWIAEGCPLHGFTLRGDE